TCLGRHQFEWAPFASYQLRSGRLIAQIAFSQCPQEVLIQLRIIKRLEASPSEIGVRQCIVRELFENNNSPSRIRKSTVRALFLITSSNESSKANVLLESVAPELIA